jgi:hypothetical protein
MDGPHLFNVFGPSLDRCKTVANWWRTIQVSYIGELAIVLAVIVVWIDVRHARAIRAAEADSPAPVGEKPSH